MAGPIIVEVVRGSIVESVHAADLAVVDREGALIESAGDPLANAAFRSSAKPIQAGVMLESGWEPAGSDRLAIACASHNGEPEHVAAVERLLADAGLAPAALQCPPALPNPSVPGVVAAAGAPARIYHNCSGKHAAMLATCVVRGWPVETYREPQHPLQGLIHETIEHLAGALLETATDGCGVVTFAAPLAAIARAFGAVRWVEPFTRAAQAMRRHPFLVGGSARVCSDVMEAMPGLTVKVGAEGLICAAGDGFALATKVRDGAARATGPVLLEMLRRLGVLPEVLPQSLEPHARPPVFGGDRSVGEIRVRD